ncbi:MAG TPA: hypothetical protein VGF55_34385 [Gemmataceae bacterium]|jgi:hypothetical protein
MLFTKSLTSARGLAAWAAVTCAVALIPSPARAAFHLWSIQEVYTNSSGTLQFIELTDTPPFDPGPPFGGFQNFVNGMTVNVSNTGATQTNTFTVPGGPLPGDTFGHTLLFGTSGIQAAGAPAPDYIIPDGFLFQSGGSVSLFGGITNSGPYTALPTDGQLSRDWATGLNLINSPTNYAGQTGVITPVPEPSPLLLSPLAAGLGGLLQWLRRRTDLRRPSRG